MTAKRSAGKKTPRRQPAPAALRKDDLLIVPCGGAELGPAQKEFNRLMRRLGSERQRLEKERARLDRDLEISIRTLMPALEELQRAERDFVFAGATAMDGVKLSKRRRGWFGELLAEKAWGLLSDPVGMHAADLERLDGIAKAFQPASAEAGGDKAALDDLREKLERTAREAGVELDMSNLDPHGDPVEFQRLLMEKMERLLEGGEDEWGFPPREPRKLTKKQLEKARLAQELEEAKKRDIKSLYKQLAKVLHPDLERDPELRSHKEEWMKRLSASYAAGNLSDMLEIEMEWLGEESGNLANATDSKLKIYSMVLKEQIETLGRQIFTLVEQPQYGPLSRFADRFTGRLGDPLAVKRELQIELRFRRGLLRKLAGDAPDLKKTMERWADEHGRVSSRVHFMF